MSIRHRGFFFLNGLLIFADNNRRKPIEFKFDFCSVFICFCQNIRCFKCVGVYKAEAVVFIAGNINACFKILVLCIHEQVQIILFKTFVHESNKGIGVIKRNISTEAVKGLFFVVKDNVDAVFLCIFEIFGKFF